MNSVTVPERAATGYMFVASDAAYGVGCYPPPQPTDGIGCDWHIVETIYHERGVTVIWRTMVQKKPECST